jgi:hypothetical protein
MASCLGCGMRPHLPECPEDKSTSRQRRWQLRQKKAGRCVTCGKKVTRKTKTAVGGERVLTTCAACRRLRELKESKEPVDETKAA